MTAEEEDVEGEESAVTLRRILHTRLLRTSLRVLGVVT